MSRCRPSSGPQSPAKAKACPSALSKYQGYFLPPTQILPFVEACGRNDAAMVFPEVTKDGLAGRRLDAGVESAV